MQDMFWSQFEKAKDTHLQYLQSEYKSAKNNGDVAKYSYKFLRQGLEDFIDD